MSLSAGDVTAVLRLRDELSGPYRQAQETMRRASADTARSIGTVATELRKADQEVARLQQQIDNFTRKTSQEFRAKTVAALDDAIKKTIDLRKEFDKAKQELAADGRPTFLDRLTDPSTLESIRNIGTRMTAMLTVPIVGAGVASVKMAADFETSMTRIHTLSGVSIEDQKRMRQAIMDLAPAVGIGPQALAEAMLAVTSTGIRGAQAIDILTISAKAAAVGLGDATTVARTITAVMKAYGEENISAAKAAEIIFKTAKDGAAEASELAGALGRVIGIASQVGVSFEDVGAYIATFTRLGVDADEAVTALRGTLGAVMKPTQDAREALASIGLTIQDVRDSIAEKGLTQAMIELVGQFNGNEEAISVLIPNVRALAGVMGTAGAQAEEMVGVEQHLKRNTDELNDAFKETAETTGQKWNKLLAELQKLAIEVGDRLLPKLRHLIDEFLIPSVEAIDNAVKAWDDLPGPVKTFAEVVLVTLAVGGPVMMALGGLASTIRSIQILMFGANVASNMSVVGWLAKLGGVGRLAALVPSAGAAVMGAGALIGGAATVGVVNAGLQGRGSTLKDDIAAVLGARKQLDSELKRLGPVNIMGVGPDGSGFVQGVEMNVEALMKQARALETVKVPTEEQKRAAQELARAHEEVRAATIPLTEAQADEAKTLLGLGVTHQSIAREIGAHIVQVKQFADALEAQERAATSSYEALRKGMADVVEMRRRAGGTQMIETDLRPLAAPDRQDYTALHLEQFVPKPSKLLASMKESLRNFPQLMVDAMTGGGGALGAFQALGSQVGSSLTSSLADSVKTKLPGMFGEALSSLIGPLGSLIGPLIGKLWAGIKRMFGGPSKREQEGRDATAAFQGRFSSFGDMVNNVGDAFAAVGRSREEAQAAVKAMLDAQRRGAEAVRQEIERLQGVLDAADRLRDGASEFGPSRSELDAAAKEAKDVYDYMVRMADQGEYTQDQVHQAYIAWQRAMAAAGNEAAKAWLEAHDAAVSGSDAASSAMDALKQKRDSLAQSIANEAPEEVMGVIEAGIRGEMAALEAQMERQAEASAEIAERAADDLADKLGNVEVPPVHVEIVWDLPPMPYERPEPDAGIPIGDGYANGTPGLGFRDFGTGRTVRLHGIEAVVPRSKAQEFAAQVTGPASDNGELLVELRAIREAIYSDRVTTVNVEGRALVEARLRVLENGGSLLTHERDVLGIS